MTGHMLIAVVIIKLAGREHELMGHFKPETVRSGEVIDRMMIFPSQDCNTFSVVTNKVFEAFPSFGNEKSSVLSEVPSAAPFVSCTDKGDDTVIELRSSIGK
jgi:hypothetical protein